MSGLATTCAHLLTEVRLRRGEQLLLAIRFPFALFRCAVYFIANSAPLNRVHLIATYHALRTYFTRVTTDTNALTQVS